MADVSPTSWRKSSYSDTGNDTCIEVAAFSPSIAIRDSKDPDGPKLIVKAQDFQYFTLAIKNL